MNFVPLKLKINLLITRMHRDIFFIFSKPFYKTYLYLMDFLDINLKLYLYQKNGTEKGHFHFAAT